MILCLTTMLPSYFWRMSAHFKMHCIVALRSRPKITTRQQWRDKQLSAVLRYHKKIYVLKNLLYKLNNNVTPTIEEYRENGESSICNTAHKLLHAVKHRIQLKINKLRKKAVLHKPIQKRSTLTRYERDLECLMPRRRSVRSLDSDRKYKVFEKNVYPTDVSRKVLPKKLDFKTNRFLFMDLMNVRKKHFDDNDSDEENDDNEDISEQVRDILSHIRYIRFQQAKDQITSVINFKLENNKSFLLAMILEPLIDQYNSDFLFIKILQNSKYYNHFSLDDIDDGSYRDRLDDYFI
uniref:ORF6 n=1 Tax=Helicoverpa SNPV AC53 TaxID=1569367 RepID=A0A075TYX2_9ABAC|nr:ORF6 [Helicoverpa SNPV AC53]